MESVFYEFFLVGEVGVQCEDGDVFGVWVGFGVVDLLQVRGDFELW